MKKKILIGAAIAVPVAVITALCVIGKKAHKEADIQDEDELI